MSSELTHASLDAHAALDHLLNDVGWGLLLTLTGLVWLVPDALVPEGVWLLGVAGILIGLNVVRFVKHMAINGFSLVLGLAALVAAFGQISGTDLPFLAILLLVIGLSLVFKPFLTRTPS